ncbi:MAG TPA: ABC transporter ATP-binding protein/permease [Geminicoccaceae bacterium]|jgi:ATP-binding cassette subfamily B protein|nr:ABC transporter ATP-binding protein/permease [Geminicoccaceae bacterium]
MTRGRSRGVDWPRIKAVILPFLWPRESLELRIRVVVAFTLLVAAKLITVQVPFFFKAVVDRLSAPEGALLALPIAALLAYGLARLTAAGFGELRDGIFAKVAERAARRVSLKVFEHLFDLALRYHLERRTGELARVTERGVQAIRFLLGVILFNVGPTLLEFGLVIGILLYKYPWPFALVTFVTIVAYAGFTFAASEWRIAIRREMNKADNEVSAQTVDSLLNYETVKAFGNEAFERDRLDGTLALYERAAVRSETSLAALNFGQAAIIALGVTVIMILAARGVVTGQLTVGDVVLVNTFLLQLYQPLNFLGVVYRQVKQSLTDLESLMGLLDLKPEISDRAGALALRLGGGEVRFEGVGFGYDPRRPILSELSFTIPAGQTLAVVGSSGAGKSTLVRLLFRFYEIDDGRILVDGQDLRDVTQASLRAAIGLVPQDTVLFNDTIGANIAYGRPGAPQAAIEAAARLAQIHEFIEHLPDGYATLVGERGLKLSGGEKQRVAIARMVLKDPPILIFDEATSQLDSRTEQLIQAALRRLSVGRTTLIIAHRLSTVVDADQILVLEHGRVVEQGRHHQLLARRGSYAQMWARQQEAPAA